MSAQGHKAITEVVKGYSMCNDLEAHATVLRMFLEFSNGLEAHAIVPTMFLELSVCCSAYRLIWNCKLQCYEAILWSSCAALENISWL